MRLLVASFACSALAFLGGCIVLYDPGDFQIAGGGTGGTGATGGTGGTGGLECSPQDLPIGTPVTTAGPHVWTWVPVPEAKCRNGSSTGFGIRIKPLSTNLIIVFGGKGACFNAVSCADNASSFGETDFNTATNSNGNAGIFSTSNTSNPVRDWNAVFIPYCTGDAYAGNKTSNVLGDPMSQNQLFVGFANVGHVMARLVPTFPNLTKVLVAGISSGSLGALYNYDRIARDFCPVPVYLIADSGPLMSDMYVAPCLQSHWRDLWGLADTLPADCQDAIQPNGGGSVNLITCLGNKYAAARLGIISSDEDADARLLLGFGQSNCATLVSGTPSPLSAMAYHDGLMELRNSYMSLSPAWGSYFEHSTSHTYLDEDATFFNTVVGSDSLTDWVNELVNGSGPVPDVGP